MYLDEKQQEIINGSLLGDGCLRVKNRGLLDNACFVKCQSKLDNAGTNKRSYMEWHYNELLPFSSGISVMKRDEEYEFRTRSVEAFTALESKWYRPSKPKRIKIVPKDIKLTPLSLCVWFMDDGSNYPEKRQAKIYSMSFTLEENEFLVNKLNNDLGIEAKTQKFKHQHCIYIGPAGYLNLIEAIKPFCIWDCFQYKHDLSKYKTQTYARGEANGMRKLNLEQIEKIRELRSQGLSQARIAEMYSVKSNTISRIISGKRWAASYKGDICRP